MRKELLDGFKVVTRKALDAAEVDPILAAGFFASILEELIYEGTKMPDYVYEKFHRELGEVCSKYSEWDKPPRV